MSTNGDNSSVRSWIEEDNKALVRSWIEESNKGSADIIDTFISTNYVHHDPANPKVRNLDQFKKDRQEFPKMHAKVEYITAEGDRVVTRLIWHGTYTGQWRGLPPPPSNEEVTLSAISSFRIAGGKIAEFWFDEVERQKKKEHLTRYLAMGLFAIVFLGVLVILAIHLLYPHLPIDAVTLGLLVVVMGLLIVAILPWLSNFLQSAKFPGGWELEFRNIRAEQIQQKSEIQAQQSEIRTLQFLIRNFVSEDELRHLQILASDGMPYRVKKDWTTEFFIQELRRLRSLRLIENKKDVTLRNMISKLDDLQEVNVKDYLVISNKGKDYLILLDKFEEQIRNSRYKTTVVGK